MNNFVIKHYDYGNLKSSEYQLKTDIYKLLPNTKPYCFCC